jgi:nucleoid-associated protein YgaU
MKDPAVKTALALCILLAGTCVSLMFRSDHPVPARLTLEPASVDDGALLRLRGDSGRLRAKASRQEVMPEGATKPEASGEPSTLSQAIVVTPSLQREAPPTLSPQYPQSTPSTKLGRDSMAMMLPVVKQDDAKRLHTVVDGDTLAGLAERYLGSAARAADLYNANRDVLQDPELLPIGVELKIPPR